MTVAELLESVRAVVEAIAPTRSPALRYKRYTGEQPFAASVASAYECFHVFAEDIRYGESFGETRELSVRVGVEVGHPAMGNELVRENHFAADIERIMDVVEDSASYGSDVQHVRFDGILTDKGNPQAWASTLFFRFSVWGRAGKA